MDKEKKITLKKSGARDMTATLDSVLAADERLDIRRN